MNWGLVESKILGPFGSLVALDHCRMFLLGPLVVASSPYIGPGIEYIASTVKFLINYLFRFYLYMFVIRKHILFEEIRLLTPQNFKIKIKIFRIITLKLSKVPPSSLDTHTAVCNCSTRCLPTHHHHPTSMHNRRLKVFNKKQVHVIK